MLPKQADDLHRRRAELLEELEAIKRKMEKQAVAEVRTYGGTKTRQRPLREQVLEVLQDLGFMAYSQQISLLVLARYGRRAPLTRFGSLSKDESRAYLKQKRPARPVWLGHALTFDRAEVIRRIWARSDWPLYERIVAPTTGRTQFLKFAARICELAQKADDWAVDPDMLRYMAADHARDLPGTRVKIGDFKFDEWRDIALSELSSVENGDVATRKEAAEALLGKLAPAFQLFGSPEPIEGGRPSPQEGMEA